MAFLIGVAIGSVLYGLCWFGRKHTPNDIPYRSPPLPNWPKKCATCGRWTDAHRAHFLEHVYDDCLDAVEGFVETTAHATMTRDGANIFLAILETYEERDRSGVLADMNNTTAHAFRLIKRGWGSVAAARGYVLTGEDVWALAWRFASRLRD